MEKALDCFRASRCPSWTLSTYLTGRDCFDAVLASLGSPASQGNLLPCSSRAALPGLAQVQRGRRGGGDPEDGAGGAGGVGTGCHGATPGHLCPRARAQARQGRQPQPLLLQEADVLNHPRYQPPPATQLSTGGDAGLQHGCVRATQRKQKPSPRSTPKPNCANTATALGEVPDPPQKCLNWVRVKRCQKIASLLLPL